MYRPTLPAVVPVPVPAFELWVGLAWWTVGAVALDAGIGTVVLAGGLVVMGWLVLTVRRTHGSGVPLRRGGVTLGLIVALSMAAAWLGWGELIAPAACVLVGIAVARLAGLLGARSVLVVGWALAALGVAGGVLALDTPGQLYGQGLIGLGAGVLLWLAGAYRTRVLTAPRR